MIVLRTRSKNSTRSSVHFYIVLFVVCTRTSPKVFLSLMYVLFENRLMINGICAESVRIFLFSLLNHYVYTWIYLIFFFLYFILLSFTRTRIQYKRPVQIEFTKIFQSLHTLFNITEYDHHHWVGKKAKQTFNTIVITMILNGFRRSQEKMEEACCMKFSSMHNNTQTNVTQYNKKISFIMFDLKGFSSLCRKIDTNTEWFIRYFVFSLLCTVFVLIHSTILVLVLYFSHWIALHWHCIFIVSLIRCLHDKWFDSLHGHTIHLLKSVV